MSCRVVRRHSFASEPGRDKLGAAIGQRVGSIVEENVFWSILGVLLVTAVVLLVVWPLAKLLFEQPQS